MAPKNSTNNLQTLLLKAQAYEQLRQTMPPKTAARLLNAPVRLLNKALAVLKATGSIENALQLAQQLGTSRIQILYAATYTQTHNHSLEETAFAFRQLLINALASPTTAPHAHRIAYIIHNFLSRNLEIPPWFPPLSLDLTSKIRYLPCTICKSEPPAEGNHLKYINSTPVPLCSNCQHLTPQPEHLAHYVHTLWSITKDLDYALEKLAQQL